MKRIFIIAISLLALSLNAYSQSRDTVTGPGGRLEGYHYTRWYDTCEVYFDTTTYFCPDSHWNTVCGAMCMSSYSALSVNPDYLELQREVVEHLAAIVGIGVWQMDPAIDPIFNYGTYVGNGERVAEYIHIFQYDRQKDTSLLIASVRWDTAAPKVLKLPCNVDTARFGFRYCHLHEVRLDTPIVVDSLFFLAGTMNNNHVENWNFRAKPTTYCCLRPPYNPRVCNPPSLHYWFRLPDSLWGSNPGSDRYGLYIPMIDYAQVDVRSDDSTMGSAGPSGKLSKWVHQTFRATPRVGYHFTHWNDGNTDNPRTVYVTQDTAFTAYFSVSAPCQVNCSSGNPDWGYVRGGGSYYEGDSVVLTAIPNDRHIHFTRWNDGNTSNPRTVYLTQDTSFTAYFEWARVRQVLCESSNHRLGYTTGGGDYYEGDTAILQAYAHTQEFPFHHWNDFDTANPRYVVVERDSSFTAFFAGQQDIAPVDEGLAGSVRLMPNPASDQVLVMSDHRMLGIEVYQSDGRQYATLEAEGYSSSLSVKNWPKGVYVLRVRTTAGTAMQKLSVE